MGRPSSYEGQGGAEEQVEVVSFEVVTVWRCRLGKRTKSLPLWEAAVHYGDRDDVRLWNDLESQGAGAPIGTVGPGSAPIDSNQHGRRSKFLELQKQLESSLVAKLREGSLLATAFVGPLEPSSRRQSVSSDLWAVLEPDFVNSDAVAEDGMFS